MRKEREHVYEARFRRFGIVFPEKKRGGEGLIGIVLFYVWG